MAVRAPAFGANAFGNTVFTQPNNNEETGVFMAILFWDM